jgi:hypothetical protein
VADEEEKDVTIYERVYEGESGKGLRWLQLGWNGKERVGGG